MDSTTLVKINMGKIQTPQTTQQEPVKHESQPDKGLRATDTDLMDLLSANIEPTEDGDYKITNEAVQLIQLKKELDIDPTDTSQDKQIERILDWAKRSGIKNRNQLVSKIREIDYKLGGADKRTKLDKIHQWVVIDSNIKGLVNKQEALRNAE